MKLVVKPEYVGRKFMNAPGKSLLKVCGILLIIFSVIALLFVGIGFVGYGQMNNPEYMQALEQAALQTGTAVPSAMETLISLLISTVGVVVQLVAGILGVKNCDRQDKAQGCFIMGILLIAYQLVSAGYTSITGSLTLWSILFVILGLILPILYVWGALKNKQVS